MSTRSPRPLASVALCIFLSVIIGQLCAVRADCTVPRSEIGLIPFDTNTILEYHITMDPALLEDMNEHGNDEEYRLASVRIRGGDVDVSFDEVGFRYKGFGSLYSCWDDVSGVRYTQDECALISTKIKFNEYDKDARFFGLKRINLHAMTRDPSKLREMLGYSLFRDFGVDAPRTAFAQLTINGEGPFLVLAVEQIDGRYTAQHYPEGGDGNLYKEVWPRAEATHDLVLEQLKTNDNPEDNPDVSAFLAFSSAVASASADSFEVDMADWLDISQLLRYMAVDRAIRNWDGLTTFYNLYPIDGPIPDFLTILHTRPNTPHNFYWYHDEEGDGRFHLIPWDLDNTLWPSDPFQNPQYYGGGEPVPNWNVKPASCEPIQLWGQGSPLAAKPAGCDRLLHLLAATQWEEFARVGQELIDSHLQYGQLSARILPWVQQLRALVAADPLLDTGQWEAEVSSLRLILLTLGNDLARHLAEGYIDASAP